MEESGLINGNKKRGAAGPLESGKCLFFSFGLVGVLLCVIASLVLNSVIFNMLNSGPHSPVISYNNTGEVPSLTVQHVAYSKIKKGQAVGICSDDLEKVCKIEVQTVTDSLLQSLKPSSNVVLISHVSDVSLPFSGLVQHAKEQNTQKIIFNAIISNFPIFYYSVTSVDILESIGEKPLDVNESFKLMGVKIINYETTEDEKSKTTNIVTFVRSSPTNDGSYLHQFKTVLVTVDQTSLKSSITVDNSTVGFSITSNLKADDEFDLKYFSIGMTQSDSPVIILYFNSVSKGCQASVMSLQNNKLAILNSLQQGPTNVGCNAGLSIFTYDANTILILSYFSLAALNVNSQNGVLTTKSVSFNYLPYRNLQFQRNLNVKFIGNDVKGKKDHRSSKFFIIFSNEANGYTQVTPVTFDGNEFSTARVTALTQSMKNVQASYFDSSQITLVYQHEDLLKSMKISFVNEQFEADGKMYSIEIPTEGIELPLKSVSPMDWTVRLPITTSGITISLLINPNSLDFQITRISTVNTINFIGIALQDSNSDDKLAVMTEGLTPLGLFTNGQFVPGQEYYASSSPDISLSPSASPQLKIGKAISSSQLLIYKH